MLARSGGSDLATAGMASPSPKKVGSVMAAANDLFRQYDLDQDGYISPESPIITIYGRITLGSAPSCRLHQPQ